ncbi:MAG: hypothetical protein EPN23_02270 [Verrucomicrobia bacterium]|nr:MAG: hypothetical protein EPN23_02270 [Verrucomicrobiota bacterium]
MKKIQVLGMSCAKCKVLATNAETAAKALGIEYELAKVTEINQIQSFGVMLTPRVGGGRYGVVRRQGLECRRDRKAHQVKPARNRRGNRNMKKDIWLVAALASVWLLAAIATDATNAPPPAAGTKPALPKLVDLGAGKCIPCRMMVPILEDLKKNYANKFRVEFIDVWKNPDAGKPYKINLIPTQIFYAANGKELFRHEGFFGKDDILAKWKELGVDLSTTK